ncbi:MAG: zf-TFIIB domain-containing protein [Verrucomicrobiota bacterium]|nr:zf-TFIIB domain-containing protein [Verrucomicrobiota bacterium]
MEKKHAGTLHCFSCGAVASTRDSRCSHCGAALATVSCPKCFGMIFKGTRFCPHCGARAAREEGEQVNLLCPSCKSNLVESRVGKVILHDCPGCQGLWVDKVSFEQIAHDAEQQSAVLGSAVEIPSSSISASMKIRYVPCPECRNLMHRINFANCSGVVVDVCKGHGTWFDRHELHQIITFIRSGGMDKSRMREREELERERRRKAAEQVPVPTTSSTQGDTDVYSALEAASDLVKWVLKNIAD